MFFLLTRCNDFSPVFKTHSLATEAEIERLDVLETQKISIHGLGVSKVNTLSSQHYKKMAANATIFYL
jgi:hypothetical protein